MRGKARQQEHLAAQSGITPACAGKSREYRVSDERSLGSPPRMRGKEASRKLRGTLKGITPAYAGKSQCNSSCTAGKWDHPRVCGEKPRQDSVGALEGRITPACAGKSLSGFLELVTGVGSPPHVRGKVGRTLYLVAGERITPAYAGKSFLQRTAQCRCQDHPRVCGEKTKKIP